MKISFKLLFFCLTMLMVTQACKKDNSSSANADAWVGVFVGPSTTSENGITIDDSASMVEITKVSDTEINMKMTIHVFGSASSNTATGTCNSETALTIEEQVTFNRNFAGSGTLSADGNTLGIDMALVNNANSYFKFTGTRQ